MNKYSLVLALIVLCTVQLTLAKKKSRPLVNIPAYGNFEGKYDTTVWSEKKFSRFIDIQYAQHPSGTRRFMPPLPYLLVQDSSHKDNVIKAYKSRNPCPSLDTLKGSIDDDDIDSLEDCLYLSVSTSNETAKQPVMVYLVGFDAIENDNNNEEASPHHILEKDVVLVSVQYRVGPFGFLSTQTNDIPDNVGILDVIEALRWVKNFISYFGGDPGRVTLFGQYHSAAIINVLAMSPLIEKEDLFHQVIYQSGSALLDGITTEEPIILAKEVAKHLKCQSLNDVSIINKCLQKATTLNLLEAYKKSTAGNKTVPFITIGGASGLLPQTPQKLYDMKKVRTYPTIGGTVKNPGVCLIEKLFNKGGKESHKKNFLEELFLSDIFSNCFHKNEDQIKYIKEKFPNNIFNNNFLKGAFPVVVDIAGLGVKYGTSQAVKYNAEQGAPSYLYTFNYGGLYSRFECFDRQFNDIALGDETIYLFPYASKVEDLSRKDIKLAKFMVELWTSFATTGKPKAHGLHAWPQLQKGIFGPYLGIDFIYKINYNFAEEYFVTLKDQAKDIDIFN